MIVYLSIWLLVGIPVDVAAATVIAYESVRHFEGEGFRDPYVSVQLHRFYLGMKSGDDLKNVHKKDKLGRIGNDFCYREKLAQKTFLSLPCNFFLQSRSGEQVASTKLLTYFLIFQGKKVQ